MHKIRSYARRAAWYDDEGESTHNPFKKIRVNRRRKRTRDIERDLALEARGPPHFADPESQEKDSPPTLAGSEDAINVSRDIDGEDDGPRRRKTTTSDAPTVADDAASGESGNGKPKFTVASQLRATVFNSWINLLLFLVPVGIALNYTSVSRTAVFVVNFLAIVPLAAMLSYATEEIALRTGETLGGLLNASFGNAVELIVAIIALVHNEFTIVQTSLIGSMLSNLLLVMGMCFFFGGINRIEQKFNEVVAQTAASLLALAVASLIIPTAFHKWASGGATHTDELSRGTSVILLVVYGAYLFFQLKSHAEIYNAPSEKTEKRNKSRAKGDTQKGIIAMSALGAGMSSQTAQRDLESRGSQEEEEEKEVPQLHFYVAILTLVISTVLVALCAEYMVDAISAVTSGSNSISQTFVGLILLPIVGNAAEHATAVTVAVKDKMDLAIGVAVGSSMQIALLVLPLIVVIGWIMGKDEMTLDFGDGFQVVVLFVAVLLVNYLIADGKSHWLEGVLLMTLYIIIAVAAWFYDS
ncbi:conserved hypothetical protein [Talaromyces stipitatus ATCC 10500]|uniref:Sodium/calcium exchanger membrane region domain-containing protein n=1 Tax=Talaromyces stipitatus (strain ATCC 10500 / CBS 375.48 / QM 6759 / NRRL 1006) TaxID=441959 RepID=B8M309_TALSN|nr:uncharacterized protein TSTA_092270 [Talaromyces stipitatus ATCC 10500]EED21985.1 conserved hypothetical protein [Talaromyces stipitatus ATCC 10500]